MAFYPQLIIDALKHVRYPGTGEDIVSAEMIDDNIRIDGNKISFSLLLEKPNDPFAKSLVKACEQAILTYVGEEAEIKGNIDIKYSTSSHPGKIIATGKKYYCSIFRERRCGQIYNLFQSCCCVGSKRLQSRIIGC